MSKKKNKKKNPGQKPQQPKQKKSGFDKYSLNELICMPTAKVMQMLLQEDDGMRADFAYPFGALMEVEDFIERYDNLRTFIMTQMFSQLNSAGLLDSKNVLTFNKNATSIIKDTSKSPAYKKLDEFKKKAPAMLQKLSRAITLMEEAFPNHPELDEFQRTTMRSCMNDALTALKERFDLKLEEVTDNE